MATGHDYGQLELSVVHEYHAVRYCTCGRSFPGAGETQGYALTEADHKWREHELAEARAVEAAEGEQSTLPGMPTL